MLQVIRKKQYDEQFIKNILTDLFLDDNDPIANVDETIEHLNFIFDQEKNDAILIILWEDKKAISMVNALEYNNIEKVWCLFSVFTKKENRHQSGGSQVVKKIINEIEKVEGKYIIAGIEPNNKESINFHLKQGFIDLQKTWDEIDPNFPEGHQAFKYNL